MKILQTIGGLSSLSGGPSTCTRDLLNGIDNADSKLIVDLLTVSDPHDGHRNLGIGQRWLKEVQYDYFTPLCLSNNLKTALSHSDYDLYHTNGMWMYVNHITCKYARDKKKPYIISPHGMLYPTALKIKPWKKVPMLWLWFNKDIYNATCLHVTCSEEMEHCRAFGYKGPIAVIPNPVVIPENVTVKSHLEPTKRIGFIGRLHPIKKIESLIYAFAEVVKSAGFELQLDIMGKGDDVYEDFLRKEVKRLDISDRVNFLGFLQGDEKYRRLSELRALFVPSVQENFGMIVPEALICGTPVYASTGTPWQELNTNNCGWWKDNSTDTITGVIRDVLAQSDSDLLSMGQNGRKMIEQNYEQSKVSKMMIDLYDWILGRNNRPDFVYE